MGFVYKNKWINVNGALIQSYYICKRQVWYMSHKIVPDQFNTNIEIGREIDSYYYNRDIKRSLIDNHIQIDVIKKDDVIAEIKKSSRHEKSAIMQLAFYLYYLKHTKGIIKRGILLFPEERKRKEIVLSEDLEEELEQTIEEINKIVKQDKPPKLERTRFCNRCGYNEICWA